MTLRPSWAAYFQARTPVPDEELIRLTSAARGAGHSWASIAAACQVRRRWDTAESSLALTAGLPTLVPGCYTKPLKARWSGSWAAAAIRR